MTETPSTRNDSVGEDQKRAALEAALRSNTFARADQLKSFLKYVCEMEIAGRGHELTEYLIGVEALGRPSNYSPGDDSAVRNRAFALRKKLQEFYEHELSDSPIRIELNKGSYCPHFVESLPGNQPVSNGIHAARDTGHSNSLAPVAYHPEPAFSPIAPLLEQPVRSRNHLWLGFVAGVALTSVIAVLVFLMTSRLSTASKGGGIHPIVAEAWGPLLTSQSEVLVSVANPPSLAIHRKENSLSYDPNAISVSKDVGEWVKQKFPMTTDQDLFFTTTTNGTYWGDSLGAMTTLKILATAGVSAQTFPEKVITIPTLRRKNVILFGAPEYSPAVAHYLEKCPLTVNYLRGIISREQSQTASLQYSIKRDQKFRALEVYGLITVLPSKSSTHDQHRTVIFSGVNSAGAQAAAEFFSSPEHLLELRKRLKEQGYDQFPAAYQVVVKAEPEENILLNFRYETHRVIPDLSIN
ncbi:MAG: hypothetical protein JST85_03730 [Acidobacteria bacterium]|nr:hypothetical protein [Acidobacteriota bacterium]